MEFLVTSWNDNNWHKNVVSEKEQNLQKRKSSDVMWTYDVFLDFYESYRTSPSLIFYVEKFFFSHGKFGILEDFFDASGFQNIL